MWPRPDRDVEDDGMEGRGGAAAAVDRDALPRSEVDAVPADLNSDRLFLTDLDMFATSSATISHAYKPTASALAGRTLDADCLAAVPLRSVRCRGRPCAPRRGNTFSPDERICRGGCRRNHAW